jgi:hypothetical protein
MAIEISPTQSTVPFIEIGRGGEERETCKHGGLLILKFPCMVTGGGGAPLHQWQIPHTEARIITVLSAFASYTRY